MNLRAISKHHQHVALHDHTFVVAFMFSNYSGFGIGSCSSTSATQSQLRWSSLQQTIVKHSFASNYGAPYLSNLIPVSYFFRVSNRKLELCSLPQNCLFTTTVFNISVASRAGQYDHLALVFFRDTEIWQKSTVMPTEEACPNPTRKR